MEYAIEIVAPSAKIITPLSWVDRYTQMVELCGRVSHKSEDKITSDSADKFIERIAIGLGHESILEHCSITVLIIGDRSMSHQLVRHRLAAYTQESQRYCDYGHEKQCNTLSVICPPSVAAISYGAVFTSADTLYNLDEIARVWVQNGLNSYRDYLLLRDAGVPAEDARSVLSNACKTEIYTTFNLRQWRHVFSMRCTPHAQWQIRGIMRGLLRQYIELMPAVYSDQKYLLED